MNSDNDDATPKTKDEWHNHWKAEFKTARDALSNWHDQGEKIDKIIRDEREATDQDQSRWNLFTANLETKTAMLYGRPPQVEVTRTWEDQNDDIGRVASDILTRVLNTDIERKSDGAKSAYRYALTDRLQAGWGLVRSRYVVEWEEDEGKEAVLDDEGAEAAPAVPPTKRKTFEDVETDYIHWKDQLWSPCRFFHEMTWWTHKSRMGRAALVKRFGEEIGNAVPLKGKNPGITDTEKRDTQWDRADVWEIWDKENEQVFWYVEDYGVLDIQEDTYQLDGFWPFPAPMAANLTTSKLVPRPDYVIAQDLYEEVNIISTRLRRMMKGLRVSGVYDSTAPEIQNMLEESGDGHLIPVTSWTALASKGGIDGCVDFFPLEQTVAAINQLRDYRRELIDAVNQITGMSDILRGEATQAGATATEQRIKAHMGSVRMQAMQDDFARFISEHQHIRAQLVAKLFDSQTIIARCNCEFSVDKDKVPAAIQLIKSPKISQYRFDVKPETISLADHASLTNERMTILSGVAGAFQSFTPIAQSMPGAMPFLLQIGQWAIAGMRGSSGLEAAFDQAIQALEEAQEQAKQQAALNPQQPPPPDPKVQAAQVKAQNDQQRGAMDMQKEQLKHQNRLEELQAETMAEDQKEQSQATWNTREAAQKAFIANSLKPPAVAPKPGGFGGGI